MKKRTFRRVSKSQVKIFKIKNRRGFAATCLNNLTEGRTVSQALDRMNKALRRSGYELK